MTDQLALPFWPRQHDLPPRWDGLPVEWGEWSDAVGMFICPPPRKPDSCPHCGWTTPPLMATGRIWTDPTTAPPAIGRARLNRGRHLVGILTVFRCVGCTRDQVLDSDGATWDLDPTDYTDDGSWEHQ